MAKKFVALLMMIVFFSSCQKNVLKKQQKNVFLQQEIEALQESVARLSDIPDVPLPVMIKKIENTNAEQDQLQIICDVYDISRADLYSYYEGEMERLGWQLQGSYDQQEGLLVFVKPGGSLCVISLRDHQQMIITIMKKKDLS